MIFLRCVAVLLVSLLLASCGSEPKSNPGVDISGNWNAVLVASGQTIPSYTFGMKFSKNAATVNGSEIAYTGGTQYNAGCVNYGGLTATGNINSGSILTLVVSDASTGASFTISGTADAAVTSINGPFSGTFAGKCSDLNGTIQFTRQ